MQNRNRLLVPEGPPFILQLISYGHANGPLTDHPLNEKARLSFSVRDVPNPPAQLRRKHSGLSARMQKEILASKAAQGRLEQILEQIEEKMTEMEEERSREPSPEIEAILKGPEPPRQLVVVVMCEEGKHRSVSFVEELSQSEGLKRRGWEVRLQHRDLGISKGGEDELDEDEDSDEQVTSPIDPRAKKVVDKRRKQQRSMSMRMMDEGSGME